MNDPLVGRTIAQRYRLISRLGAGGMASVYLARHVLIERLIAIKLVHQELGGDAVYKERILREARAVNRINHPNIVEVTDYGEADGLVYLVMEYVPGESLHKVLERGPLGWKRAANLGQQVASALGRAHEMGVIHRDLTPSNILLVERKDGGDLVKLTDFGVAKMLDASTLTVGSVAFGTPGYVAPEYRHYGAVDARSDLFSLGVVLYQAMSGELPALQRTAGLPVAGAGFPQGPVERLSALVPDLPELFDEVVMTLLAPDPDDRPRDGFEAYDLLRRVLERDGGGTVPPRPSVPDLGTTSGLSAFAPRTEVRVTTAPRVAPDPGVEAGRDPAGRDRGEGLAGAAPSLGLGLGADHASIAPAAPEREGSVPPGSWASLSLRRGPHLTTVSIDRVAPLCASALRNLNAQVASRGTDALEGEAGKLVGMVETIGGMVAEDTRRIEAVQGRSRGLRAELGKELDRLAREHSRTLGWAGTIAERTYLVHSRRVSGEHPIPFVDAMVWEQAALEQEEDRARARADDLLAQMQSCRAGIDLQNEHLEHEMLVVTAQLEGRIAALRSLALEAALVLEETAARLDLSRDALWGTAPPAPAAGRPA